tara:strand:- start:507 stop:1334 length:828 start_codon:yes stop_codon:yes gene_type:complete
MKNRLNDFTRTVVVMGVTLLLIVFSGTRTTAQLLFPETFVVIFDTTRNFKGSISPSLEVKTPKDLYIEITNRADMAYKFKNHALVLANKFEFTKSGDETILSGGFLYAKFKTFYDNPLVVEHYLQYQWAEARGMERKYAFGSNLRYKIYKNIRSGAFAGLGLFYESEKWNYQAVPDERTPGNTNPLEVDYIKLNAYLSVKQTISDNIKGEAAFYLQDNFEDFLKTPRIGGSAGLSFAITKNVAFGVQFRMLYDYEPIVPVDKLWFSTFTELQVTF